MLGKIFGIFLIVLATSIGLAFLTIPNERSYWPADFQFAGTIEVGSGRPASLPFQFDNPESNTVLTTRFTPYILPFMSRQMSSVARSYISINGTNPTSDSGTFLAQWPGNWSGVQNYPTPFGWDIGDGAGNITMNKETLLISPQSRFVTVYNFQDKPFSSDISNLILVKMPMLQNTEWNLNILVNGTWTGLSDLQGIRDHQIPGVFAFQLSPGLRFQSPSLTVSLLGQTLRGYAGLALVEFGHITNGGIFSMTINGNAISTTHVFPANLTSNWPTTSIISEFQFPTSDLLADVNTAVLSTEGGVHWTINSIVLHVYVETSKENPQAWSQLPIPLFVYGIFTIVLIIGSLFSARRFFAWLQAATLESRQETS